KSLSLKTAKAAHVISNPHVVNMHHDAPRVLKGRDESASRHAGVLIDMSDQEATADAGDDDFEKY
ncbi:MAG: hypothetical protein ACLQDF_13265, partial [Desulfomonilia bacterium]